MTQPVTPWLPGQSPVAGMNYGHLALPGINDQTPPRPAGASYPPSIGGKWIPPEDVNLDGGPVKPDNITLDEGPGTAPSAAPAGAPIQAGALAPLTGPVRAPSGWRVKNARGEVVAELPNINTHDYQKAQVQKVGESLLNQAVTPADKESASRASAYMLSLVGLMPVAEITKRGIAQYDVDQRNDISRDIQRQKNERAKLMGKGGPVGPSKADKFQASLDKELRSTVDGVIESERKGTKYAAISEQENNIAQMDQLLAAPNAMGQRVAVQRALLELTGKASRESEQAALTGASGKWEELKNRLSLWTSDDPQLSQKYIQEFRQMLATQRQYIAQQKAKIAEAAASRAYAESFGYPDDQRQLAYSVVKGSMTGNFEGPAAYKSSPSKGPAKPAAGHVDEDLLK